MVLRSLPVLVLALVGATAAAKDYTAESTPALHGMLAASLGGAKLRTSLDIVNELLGRDSTGADPTLRSKRATLRLALGMYDPAELLSVEMAAEAGRAYLRLGDYTKAAPLVKGQDQTDLATAKSELGRAERASSSSRWAECLEATTALTKLSPRSVEPLRLRLECALRAAAYAEAAAAAQRLYAITAAIEDGLAFVALSVASLSADEGDEGDAAAGALRPALEAVRALARSDPDSRPIVRTFRALKKLDAEWRALPAHAAGKRWASVANRISSPATGVRSIVQTVLDQVPGLAIVLAETPFGRWADREVCRAHVLGKNTAAATTACRRAFEHSAEATYVIIGAKVDPLMAAEDYAGALEWLDRIKDRPEDGIRDRYATARARARMVDYYKVLGVARTAEPAEIKRAFKKASMKAHPDKGGSVEKMEELNKAYGVLGDADARRRYDAGEDPEDPTGGHGGGGGGHPFGNHPFGNGHFHQQQRQQNPFQHMFNNMKFNH